MNVAKRSFLKSKEAVIATETAFLMPVLLIGLMMFLELARVVLIISIGSTAMTAAVESLRQEETLDEATVQQLVTERMADSHYSYGFLSASDIEVAVEKFDSLENMGVAQGEAASQDKNQNEKAIKELPVWSVTVDVKKDYLTPLPRLLTLDKSFRYRFKQVIGHLYEDSTAQQKGSTAS